ncbi:nucleoside hydrolase-like domain-containing protein [Sphingosinicella sp. BN140058]|uniref:DUF1593 domain-containing protein n=1 Tax=Sphingosinicella sp. BN140058 TaxID=1892855 RepID=UPI00352BA8AF
MKALAFAALVAAPPAVQAQDAPKPRVLLISDIGNEPDDSESFVRFLLYANEFDVEGIVAATSTHQRNRVRPDLFQERIAAYGRVLPNLRRHASGYPDAARLQSLVRSGVSRYGMDGVGPGKDSAASRLIVAAVDRADDRPVWIPTWGGAADLAQALWTVRETRSAEDLATFVSRLRVYSISDQDDAGPWIRRTFPQIFWIASVHGWNQYDMAAWTGISRDVMLPDKWPAAETVTNGWLAAHIRKGPLGSLYPPHQFIMEGDTPSFLSLIPNGLNNPERPDHGGWGGRYVRSDLAAGHYGDAVDTFTAADGTRYASNQATIFRWRDAFQRDFAARVQWSITAKVEDANHAPNLVVNAQAGQRPLTIAGRSGDRILLDAAGSSDPDGNVLAYRWWHYAEPSGGFRPPTIALHGSASAKADFIIPKVDAPTDIHVILEVTDNGVPALTRYRRVIVAARP